MNAIELMKKDHRTVEKLFKDIEATSDQALMTREELFANLKMELDAHAYMEEQAFYPIIEAKELTRDLTLEAYEEHNVVKALLQELAGMPKDNEFWMAKFTVLKENVTHHVKEEEEELFPKVEKSMSEEELQELGIKMETTKNMFLEDETA